MPGKLSCTYTEKMQSYVDEYYEETGKASVTTKELAIWAIQTNRWEPPQGLIVKKCQEDFARALRAQYIPNDHGQPVRVKHVARIIRGDQQLHLWADIRHAPQEHMEIAFHQRRDQIVGDCKQLKRDIDYYNEQNIGAQSFQMLFDFRDDIEEGQFSEYYPAKRPTIVESTPESTMSIKPYKIAK